jgi:Thiol-disulfide isomerase and thioredoxins
MKRIEILLKIFSGFLVAAIFIILAVGCVSIYKTATGGDFTETPGISLSAIKEETDKHRVLLLFYKQWCPWCRAVKPVFNDVKQANAVNTMPRVININVESNAGKVIVAKYLTASTVPSLVLLNKGGQVISTITHNGKVYNYPSSEDFISAKPGVAKVTRPEQVQVNRDYLEAAISESWGTVNEH